MQIIIFCSSKFEALINQKTFYSTKNLRNLQIIRIHFFNTLQSFYFMEISLQQESAFYIFPFHKRAIPCELTQAKIQFQNFSLRKYIISISNVIREKCDFLQFDFKLAFDKDLKYSLIENMVCLFTWNDLRLILCSRFSVFMSIINRTLKL